MAYFRGLELNPLIPKDLVINQDNRRSTAFIKYMLTVGVTPTPLRIGLLEDFFKLQQYVPFRPHLRRYLPVYTLLSAYTNSIFEHK
jgi:hypothetical protein